MAEFENNNNITVEHKFHVDEVNDRKKSKYDMIIGSDLLWNMGIDISYSKERVEWMDIWVPLKELDTLADCEICEILYSIHTDAPILKEMEERQNRILDADYSKVNIPAMVADLDISDSSKRKLQTTLEKFSELFGGKWGFLKRFAPASSKLVDGAKPYQGRYYSIPTKVLLTGCKEGSSLDGCNWRPQGNEIQRG